MKTTLGPNASFMQRKLLKLWQLRMARLQSLLQPKQFFLLRLAALYLHSPSNQDGQVPQAHGFSHWQPDSEQCRLFSALHQDEKPCQSQNQRLHGLWLAQSPSGWLNPKAIFKFWLFSSALSPEEEQELKAYCQMLSELAHEQGMAWHFDIIQQDEQDCFLLPRYWPDNRKQLLDGIFLAGRVPNWFYLEYGEEAHPQLLPVVEGPKDLQLANWVAKQLRASLEHPLKSPPWLAEALLLLRHYPKDYLDAHKRRQEIQTQPAEKLLDIGFHFAKRLAQDLVDYRQLINDACYLGIGINTSRPAANTDWRTLMARQWANQQQFSHKHRMFLDSPEQWLLSDYLHWQQSLLSLWQECADQLLIFCQQQRLMLPAIHDLLSMVCACRAHDRLLPGFQGRIQQPDVQLLEYDQGWRWMTPEGHSGPSKPFLELLASGVLSDRVGKEMPTCTPKAPISQQHWQQLVEIIWLWRKQPKPCYCLFDHQDLQGLIELRPNQEPRVYSAGQLDDQGLRLVLACPSPLVVVGQSERCQWWPLYQRTYQAQPAKHGRWLLGTGSQLRLLDLQQRGIKQDFVEDQQHLLQLLAKNSDDWQPLFFAKHAQQKWPQIAALFTQHQAGQVRLMVLQLPANSLELWVLDEFATLKRLQFSSQDSESTLCAFIDFLAQYHSQTSEPLSSWLELLHYQVDRQGGKLEPHPIPDCAPRDWSQIELQGKETGAALAAKFASAWQQST